MGLIQGGVADGAGLTQSTVVIGERAGIEEFGLKVLRSVIYGMS